MDPYNLVYPTSLHICNLLPTTSIDNDFATYRTQQNMEPGEYDRAERASQQYGHHFDSNMDRKYFPEPLRIKSGKLAARQPEIPKANTPYWKTQCSLRGLKTNGDIELLQTRLKTRDKSKDAVIEKLCQEASALVWEEDRRRAAATAESWWTDPSRTFREHLDKDSRRALEET